MLDLCLKFADEDTAKLVLYSVQTVVERPPEPGAETQPQAGLQYTASYRNIDVIGTIYEPTGSTPAGDLGEYPEMAAVPGWHVNVLVLDDEDAAPLQPYVVAPTQRLRVWA